MRDASTSKRRSKIASILERASVPETPCPRGVPYLVHPDISTACSPYLLSIATVVRDQRQAVEEETLHALLVFVLDGESSFFGRDPATAVQDAALLLHLALSGTTRRPSRGVVRRIASAQLVFG